MKEARCVRLPEGDNVGGPVVGGHIFEGPWKGHWPSLALRTPWGHLPTSSLEALHDGRLDAGRDMVVTANYPTIK